MQQLIYLKAKLDGRVRGLKEDEEELDKARSTLASCYLAMPYVDILQTYQQTNQQNNIILTDPETFSDPVNGGSVNVSKYCTGFNYNDSSCLKKCNDMCPDTGGSYGGCTDAASCLTAYNSRPCPYGDGSSSNFGDCVSSCQTTCQTACDKKYPSKCGGEYNLCSSQCKSNGQCVLDNAGKCLFDDKTAANFASCSANATDEGNTKYCIDNAYLCKNGSDEYAGYSDCLDTTTSGCSTSTYSSSFLYNDKINNAGKCQKCSDQYSPPKEGTACYSAEDTSASCQELCPETAKCTDSSNCPDCPCDEIVNQSLNFYKPNEGIPATKPVGVCGWPFASLLGNAGCEGYNTDTDTVSTYDMTGAQCDSYSYNDDPLTFYCEDNWWNDQNREGTSPTPIGSERMCTQSGNVPVGETVDNAKSWADALISNASGISDDLGNIINDPLGSMEILGDATYVPGVGDYCKCNAKDILDSPVCTTNCQYWEISWFHIVSVCGCYFTPCQGNPCRQMLDFETELWDDYKQLEGDFINFYTTIIKEPRSDIMKELTYSRKQTDSCSLVNSTNDLSSRLFDCTRVEDELMPPINNGEITFNNGSVNETIAGYCYGKELGKILTSPLDLTDDWFCCNEFQNVPTLRNQPK
jgi:hypothetical protein